MVRERISDSAPEVRCSLQSRGEEPKNVDLLSEVGKMSIEDNVGELFTSLR